MNNWLNNHLPTPKNNTNIPAEMPPPAPTHEFPYLEHEFTIERYILERVPNFTHFTVLVLIAVVSMLCASLFMLAAYSLHLFGVTHREQVAQNIFYTLGSQGLWYLFLLMGCIFIFPRVWHKSFFAGIHWNGEHALQQSRKLFGAAFLCVVLALVDTVLLPSPSNVPIEKALQTPGAAWLLFLFGVTAAPLIEEIFFRGFLLPALCTAYDWINERIHYKQPPELDPTGHPQWSLPAMAVSSLLTSIPFALMHGQQTGYSLGPFLLLVCVSMVLCWARLHTRSLAASVFVHFSYNFLLFSMMLISTQGFRHMDKM